MKKFFITVVAALAAMVSFAASAAKAPDGVTAFNDSSSCLSAVASGKALAYVPATSRTPGSAYAQMSIAEAGYASGACVQGLTTFTSGAWVYLPPTFQVGRNGEHLVMWQCGNAITSIASVPAKQQVTFAPPTTSFIAAPAACSDTAERCALIEWCNTNDSWKVIEGVRTCEVSGRRDRIIQRDTLDIERQLVVNPRVLPTQVNAWQGNGDFTVPSAPQARGIIQAPQGPLIDIRRAAPPTVQGTKCQFDCITRAVNVQGQQNVSSPNGQCEIVLQNNNGAVIGRLLLDNHAKRIRLASVTGNSVTKVNVTPWQTTTTCAGDKALIKANWNDAVREMGLPACQPSSG